MLSYSRRVAAEKELHPDPHLDKFLQAQALQDAPESQQQQALTHADKESKPQAQLTLKSAGGWTEEQAYSAASEAIDKAKQAGKQTGRSRSAPALVI